MKTQAAILQPISSHARFLEFAIDDKSAVSDSVSYLVSLPGGLNTDLEVIVGLGLPLTNLLDLSISGLSSFPEIPGSVDVPSTQEALWICVRGNSPGEITLAAKDIEGNLAPAFRRIRLVDGFKYDTGRDLTGYEDGTENPEGDDAVAAAIVSEGEELLDGSSFVAVQQWKHDFSAFDAMTEEQQDNAIGRYRQSNDEFDAPATAHVKRTAQENFDPEAFVVRRSMPWSDENGSGLMFIAFGASFYAYQAQMVRMSGAEDGIVDALFDFSQPITGAYYWCPGIDEHGRLAMGK
jgi:putative iron-dependent peroxidase